MNENTLLHRQIHPSWLRYDGDPNAQAFKPTRKDNGLLSCYDGDLITAEDSWKHYTGQLMLSSVGSVSVTVSECGEQELPVIPDPASFPEHVLIDFRGLTRREIEQKADALKKAANARGWQFGPLAQP